MHCLLLTPKQFKIKLIEKWGVVDKGGDKSCLGG